MDKLKGLVLGLLSGVFWGLDTVLNSLVLLSLPFTLVEPRLVSPVLLLAFFHDALSAVLLTFLLGLKGRLSSLFSIMKKKSVYFVMIASVCAGPLGMRSYLSAVEMLGSSLTATISALYPALAALLGAIFLRDCLTKRGWFGLCFILAAVIQLGFSRIELGQQTLFGLLAALLCVIGWASESVITAYGMKDDVSPDQALFIRQWTSTIVYVLLMVSEGDFVYSMIKVATSDRFWLLILLAAIGTLSYLCYYSSINSIGPVKATGLNVTYAIWATLFSIVVFGGAVDIKLVICGLLIVCGSSLMIKNEP